MRKHYIFAGAIMLVGLLGAAGIIMSSPSRSAPGTALSTATPDRREALSGGSIEGQLVFSRDGWLWSWRADKANRLPVDPGKSVVANTTVRLVNPALSLDGTRLAFIRQDETFSDLWVAAADGTAARPLTSNRGGGTPRSPNFIEASLWAFSPTWSPDGTEIAYLSDVRTDDLALWATNSSRFSQRVISRVAVGQGGFLRPGWSPQGDNLVTAAFENGKSQIYTIKASGGAATRLTEVPEGAYDPAWSPDGKLIAYIARRGNTGELWVMKADGNGATLLTTQSSRSPSFSPDGKKLAYLGLKDGAFEIHILELTATGTTSGNSRQLSTGARLDGTGGLSWSR